jgi:hypothetical protein
MARTHGRHGSRRVFDLAPHDGRLRPAPQDALIEYSAGVLFSHGGSIGTFMTGRTRVVLDPVWSDEMLGRVLRSAMHGAYEQAQAQIADLGLVPKADDPPGMAVQFEATVDVFAEADEGEA